jgi:hypothetical protein
MTRFPAVAAACFVALSCAVSEPADTTPDIVPGLPGVDAGSDPVPAKTTTGADAAVPPPPPAPPPDEKSAALDKPGPGDVLITEVMFNPSGPEPKSEWIELTNTTSAPLALDGLSIVDGAGRTHAIATGTTLAPGAHAIFARDKATAIAQKVPSTAVVYEYGTGIADTAGVLLTNGTTGAVSLKDGSQTIADAPYGPDYSTANGCSIQLDSKGAWCFSINAWATGSDKGTPGGASDCP